MGHARRFPRRFGLAVLAAGLLLPWPAEAQEFGGVAGLQGPGALAGGLPQLPPQGAWGEVINVTDRWIVVQNHLGQQFPVSLDDIQEFLIRWPNSFDALHRETVVEAVGQDVGSNIVRTDHIDVFEGTDTTLVAPTYNSVLPNNMVVTTLDPGFNRFMNAWDYSGQNMLYGWAYPVPSSNNGIPSRLHVVGAVAAVDLASSGVQISLPGNNLATILPAAGGGMTITQITRGTPRLTRKGDYAFMLPLQVSPRGLALSQLVIYKQISLLQFNAGR